MKALKKTINKIDSAVMSPRLQSMLPGALETAERIANTSTHSAKRYSRLLASEVAQSAARGIGPGALIGAGYGLISDKESVIDGAIKGAMTGAALAGGYATYRARAMLGSAGARFMGKSTAKRRTDAHIKQFKERARIGELLKSYRDPDTGRVGQKYYDELLQMYNGRIPKSAIRAHKKMGIEIPYQYTYAGSLDDYYTNMRSTLDEF